MRGRIRLVGGLAAMAVALAVAPAAARDRVITVPTQPEPGPAQFNQVTVHQFGPAAAKHVLVLMPGTQGGAGDFTLDARYLVKHDRDLQVWAIDRRTQALEDTSVFAEAQNGQVSLQQAFDYYLGWIFNGGNEHSSSGTRTKTPTLASGAWRWRSTTPAPSFSRLAHTAGGRSSSAGTRSEPR